MNENYSHSQISEILFKNMMARSNSYHNDMLKRSESDSDCFTRVENLTAPEVFWLWAIHYWVQSRANKVDPIPMFSRAFWEVKIVTNPDNDMAPEFDYTLSILKDFAKHPLSVGCRCCCGFLGRTEQIVLGCMALQQKDCNPKNVSGIILQNVLPELLANTVLITLKDLSQASLRTGMALPVRPPYLDLANKMNWFQTTSIRGIESIN